MKHKYTGQVDSNMNPIKVGDILACCSTFWAVEEGVSHWDIGHHNVRNIENDYQMGLVEFIEQMTSDDLSVIVV